MADRMIKNSVHLMTAAILLVTGLAMAGEVKLPAAAKTELEYACEWQ